MAVIIGNQIEQENFEAAADKIVKGEKNYTAFRYYMKEPCEDIDICGSCTCPKDSRLNDKEKEDALLACGLAAADRNRIGASAIYLCICGHPRRKGHHLCEACKIIKAEQRNSRKKRKNYTLFKGA